jgi:hypothetical protein
MKLCANYGDVYISLPRCFRGISKSVIYLTVLNYFLIGQYLLITS